MRFLYQPIIPPRMVAMGFLSRRSESLVLCGRTEAANAITRSFREESGRFDATASRLRKTEGAVFFGWGQSQLRSALRIVDHLRRRFARLRLCAHLLQACSKRFNLLLLLCGSRFLLCDNRL